MSIVLLDDMQLRILGSLMEKQVTTPDQYPLSLNALTNACNQKSNRDPVVNYEQGEVQIAIDTLINQAMVIDSSDFNSRSAKLQHRFCNTEFSDRQFNKQEFAIICLLFLRGPQTPGELKSRSGRLCQFENSAEVESCLKNLSDKAGVQYVQQLPREPGKRESRFSHCFSEHVSQSVTAEFEAHPQVIESNNKELEEKVGYLEDKVIDLESRLAALEDALN
ncbi:hypothetical protein MED121_06455 [Marinomonas sp. MED121]|uniref:YceH family protein n=1 Tax=Marinomonas sp. MED121 TaxID=314277 RepID=UPI00006902F4|nr:YceH family protein [Marinomonas sp. MED121]EAQ66302.1 hypothetical protein MED121_06455 [Marinomonas sp. MED121]